MGRFLIAGVALFLMACGSDPVGSQESIETLGEACTVLGDSICVRAGECQILAQLGLRSVAACESMFVSGCCAQDGTCAQRTRDPMAAMTSLNKCARDLDQWDCTALAQALLPPTCLAPQ